MFKVNWKILRKSTKFPKLQNQGIIRRAPHILQTKGKKAATLGRPDRVAPPGQTSETQPSLAWRYCYLVRLRAAVFFYFSMLIPSSSSSCNDRVNFPELYCIKAGSAAGAPAKPAWRHWAKKKLVSKFIRGLGTEKNLVARSALRGGVTLSIFINFL